jgi:hypothetical protein
LGLDHSLKAFYGPSLARSSSIKTIEKELKEEVKKAATRLEQNTTNMLKPEKPIKAGKLFRRLILPMRPESF